MKRRLSLLILLTLIVSACAGPIAFRSSTHSKGSRSSAFNRNTNSIWFAAD